MRIIVNGAPRETGAGTLAELLAELAVEAAAVATAVNGEFAPASARARLTLNEGDAVEIVAPRQGG